MQIFTSCYDGFIRVMDTGKRYLICFTLVSILCFLFHSSQQHEHPISSEEQGGMKIWDVRTGKASSEWLLHGARINTIEYNLRNTNIMATSSTDSTACIWDLTSMTTDKPKPLKTSQHKRAVHSSYFSPSGSSLATRRAICGWDDSYIFIGNMKRGVDVVSPTRRKTTMTLQSPDVSAIPCRFHAHPHQVGMLAGATGGGQVYVWTSS